MSRTQVTYPPEMLPKASDPKTAEVIVCQPPQNDEPVKTGTFSHAVNGVYQLSGRTKLQ